jgi:hypothetical protein
MWVISNLCRGTPPPTYHMIDSALPILCRSLNSKLFQTTQQKNTIRVISDVLWTLATYT